MRTPSVRLIAILAIAPFGWMGCAHSRLGVRDGKLAPCPRSPNCVSTQAEDALHRMEPLTYSGPLNEAKRRILEILRSMPRVRIVEESDVYIHATFRSRLFRFVDDVEFYFDDANKTIHFRSASRLGYSDLGVNRTRMESIRQRYTEKR